MSAPRPWFADGIETVNGGIELADDAASLGKIETVNGRIELGARAQANAGIELVNGGVELKQAARVTGDIVVKKPGGMGWFSQKQKPPRVILGPDSVVNGNLVFEHDVELYMHTSAKISGKQSGPLVGGKIIPSAVTHRRCNGHPCAACSAANAGPPSRNGLADLLHECARCRPGHFGSMRSCWGLIPARIRGMNQRRRLQRIND
jgi:hypothetical protein